MEDQKTEHELMTDISELWHLLNTHCTDSQRDDFNEWRSELWLVADSLRDQVRRFSMQQDKDIPVQMEQLMKAITRIPFFAE